MKNLLCLLCLLAFVACKKDVVKNPAPTADPHAGHNHAPGEHHHGSDNVTTNADGTVHVKGDRTAFLVGLWEFQYVLVGATPRPDKRFMGRWIDMKGDFTFTSGQYDQQTNSGTYSYTDQGNPTIVLNPEKQEEGLLPNSAEVKYSGGMVWIGEVPAEGKLAQYKLSQTGTKPTKE